MSREDQVYIVGAVEDGCAWRGDEIEFYKLVYEQKEICNEFGVKDYVWGSRFCRNRLNALFFKV
jgi:hypothetical protein